MIKIIHPLYILILFLVLPLRADPEELNVLFVGNSYRKSPISC